MYLDIPLIIIFLIIFYSTLVDTISIVNLKKSDELDIGVVIFAHEKLFKTETKRTLKLK